MPRMLAALLLSAASLAFAGPAAAAPPSSGPKPVQSNQGAASGTVFTASLAKTPAAGNSVVIVVGADSFATLDADDISNVVQVSVSNASYGVAGAPYGWLFAADAGSVKSWSFHLAAARQVTWLAVEVSGLVKFESGVPRWDGGAFSSAYTLGGSSLATGTGSGTVNPREFLVSSFVARAASGTAPTVSGFSSGWSRLGASVTSGTVRLDVAWRPVTATGQYGCTATYTSAPAGVSGWVTGFAAV